MIVPYREELDGFFGPGGEMAEYGRCWFDGGRGQQWHLDSDGQREGHMTKDKAVSSTIFAFQLSGLNPTTWLSDPQWAYLRLLLLKA